MTLATEGIQLRTVDIVHSQTQPKPQLQSPNVSRWACLAPALASGLLLWMCYFPLGWGWLGWVALVPLLSLVRAQTSPRRIYWCTFLCGVLFFAPILSWMTVADNRMIITWVMLSIYCALFFVVTIWLLRLLDGRTFLPLFITAPIAWIAMEWVRSWLLEGFAWYYLGHTQHAMLSLIQIADLGGVYLVSFLVVAVNGWLFDVLYQVPGLRERFVWQESSASSGLSVRRIPWRAGLILEAGLLIAAFVGTVVYGTWRLGQNQFQHGPLIALMQTNLDQRIRNEGTDPQQRQKVQTQIARHCDRLCRLAVSSAPLPELLVWPETSYLPDFPWLESSPRLPLAEIPEIWRKNELTVHQHFRNELLKFYPLNHLLGINSYVLDEQAKELHYNSALLVRKNGSFAERYDKMHRVPFGEYVPLREWLPIMDKLAPYDFDYSIRRGEKFTRFELGKYKFGVLICYEDTDPILAPRYVRDETDGSPVDFLVNISNDGWFNGTSEHDEHLAISRFRAIECRRALARAVNMGISAVIDGNGRVLQPQELPPPGEPHTWKIYDDQEIPDVQWPSFKKTAGILLAHVPIDTRESFYARTGDWLPYGCWAVLGATMAWALVRRWGKRKVPSTAPA